jgi:tryptophanyl-tRNA synthetase
LSKETIDRVLDSSSILLFLEAIMSQPITLTGITTTGAPHLGNYAGAILPAIEASHRRDTQSYFFLADYHALVKSRDPLLVQRSRLEVAAAWLALGLNTKSAVFYAQSDIPEIVELAWILTCITPKAVMNRAHAYKAATAENLGSSEKDPDTGISMGLYSYPILMAADILLFQANRVPVGKDQVQHLEMARDIAARFNHHYGLHLVLPEAVVNKKVAVLPGLDGRKMSKSYGNTIPLFVPEKQLFALIRSIKTNSLPPEAPKDPDTCTLFQLYQPFASEQEVKALRARYAQGIGWGEMKQLLFETINQRLQPARAHHEQLLAQPRLIQQILDQGAERARARAAPFLQRLRHAVGTKPLG